MTQRKRRRVTICEDVLNLQEILLNLEEEHRPYVTLTVKHKDIVFLCDTGACKTVIVQKDKPPGVTYSNDKIMIKSATGHATIEMLTQPLPLKDEVTGKIINAQILISNSCPLNLLGREEMQQLNIGVIPTEKGMRAVRLPTAEQPQIFVIEVKNPDIVTQST